MTVQVSSESGYVALQNPGATVSTETVYVALMNARQEVSTQSVYVALFSEQTGDRRKQAMLNTF